MVDKSSYRNPNMVWRPERKPPGDRYGSGSYNKDGRTGYQVGNYQQTGDRSYQTGDRNYQSGERPSWKSNRWSDNNSQPHDGGGNNPVAAGAVGGTAGTGVRKERDDHNKDRDSGQVWRKATRSGSDEPISNNSGGLKNNNAESTVNSRPNRPPNLEGHAEVKAPTGWTKVKNPFFKDKEVTES